MSTQRVAVVTGGASGIGLAASRRLVERGYTVAVVDLNADALAAVQSELGTDASTFAVDVSDPEAVAALAAEVESMLGPVDHILGCAGIARVGSTFDLPREDIALMMRANFDGVVNLTHSFLPRMIERGRGEFAVIASVTGLVPPKKMSAYGATKAAVISYLTSLSYEVADTGVTLAVVCPAAVATPMAEDFFKDPAKRAKSMAVSPEEIVKAIERGLRAKRFLIVPGMARWAYAMQRVSPRVTRVVQRSRLGNLVS